ncbi:MAG: hypothetical protein IPM95_00375 [Sphingobacteriales bacterium]|jgi:thiol-disulfide isomerase/thioredoxin|nr:hypothetical protein [Sphingobacteriales bacterium]
MKTILLLSAIFLTGSSCLFAGKKNIVFPTFSLLRMDSINYLTNEDLAKNKNTVFINFSPTCEHCQRTINSILVNISKFEETQFVLSSFDDFSVIRRFYFNYFLNSFTNVFIGKDIDFALTKQIQYSSFPCLVIFDKNNVWKKTIPGEINAKDLLKVIEK